MKRVSRCQGNAVSIAVEANRCSGRFHHRASRTGRRRRAGYGAYRLSHRKFSGSCRAWEFVLLGYKDDVPVVSAPGCFRSAKPNIVDLVLPPMLARYRVSGWEIACLGHGGLLAY